MLLVIYKISMVYIVFIAIDIELTNKEVDRKSIPDAPISIAVVNSLDIRI